MTRHFAAVLCLAAVLALLGGCCVQPGSAIVVGTGRITYVDFEGGFYGITADDGARYLPLNLPGEFGQDGLRVKFEGVVRNDISTVQQWGSPFEVTAIAGGDMAWTKIATG